MASVYFTIVVYIICCEFLMFNCVVGEKCYVKASCTRENNFLKMTDQSTAKKCERSCSKDDDECKWWTFRPNVKKCRLYKGKNCGLDYKKKNQISGQRGCDAKQKPVGSPGNPPIPAGNRDDNVCFVKAACTKDDNLLESNDQSSALECFKSCLDDNEDCQWWTFRPNLNQCDLYSGSDCGLDYDKEVQISGQRNCNDPSRPTVSPCPQCGCQGCGGAACSSQSCCVCPGCTGNCGPRRFLNFIFSIDFSGSTETLHKEGKFAKAIQALGNIIQKYDVDNHFPALGFGATKLGDDFHLDLTGVCCYGISGVLSAYWPITKKVQYGSYDRYGPSIFKATEMARQDPYHHTVLLLVGDVGSTHPDQAIEAMITASEVPMSIVLIALLSGSESAKMKEFDNDGKLLSYNGRTARMDVVQYVDINQYYGNPHALETELFAEVPQNGYPGYGQAPPPIPVGYPGYGQVPPPVPAYG